MCKDTADFSFLLFWHSRPLTITTIRRLSELSMVHVEIIPDDYFLLQCRDDIDRLVQEKKNEKPPSDA